MNIFSHRSFAILLYLLCCVLGSAGTMHGLEESAISNTPLVSREHLRLLLVGECCLDKAAELKIAEVLQGGPLDIEGLATAIQASHESLQNLLQMLVTFGVFEEVAPGIFANNDASLLLAKTPRDSQKALSTFFNERCICEGQLTANNNSTRAFLGPLANNPKVTDANKRVIKINFFKHNGQWGAGEWAIAYSDHNGTQMKQLGCFKTTITSNNGRQVTLYKPAYWGPFKKTIHINCSQNTSVIAAKLTTSNPDLSELSVVVDSADESLIKLTDGEHFSIKAQ